MSCYDIKAPSKAKTHNHDLAASYVFSVSPSNTSSEIDKAEIVAQVWVCGDLDLRSVISVKTVFERANLSLTLYKCICCVLRGSLVTKVES